MRTIISRVWAALAPRGAQPRPRGDETGREQGSSGLDPSRVLHLVFGANPGILGLVAVPGHASIGALGSTATVVLVVLVVVGIVANTVGTGRHARRAVRRRSRRPQRATAVGVLALGVILGATVAGGRIAHAAVGALVALGHLLAGMLP